MLQIETWWLFALPIVFALGWVGARWDMRLEKRENEIERLAQQKSTFKGLNLLLNEEPDKAIDALVQIAQLDPETTELHFALGSLFRRRGETERAIRVHQHLANREDLPSRHRDHAAYELGRDFLRAGLLDRAETSLNRVGTDSKYGIPAKESLLEMYQVEKDWAKAIISSNELEVLQGKSRQKEIAHFNCELAEEALRRKDIATAERHIDLAMQSVPSHPRATILRGDCFVAQNQLEKAVATWSLIAQNHPAYLALVADRWIDVHKALSKADEGLQVLVDALKTQAGGELLDITFKHVMALRGVPQAEALMNEVMRHTPSLSAMALRVQARLTLAEVAQNDKAAQEFKASYGLLKQRTNTLARYTCGNCGFRARRFYWQCPGCNHWESYSPRRGEGAAPSGPSM
ncbi:lipopolysaccharide assembly protein LapB [Polynucleobacter victoriensis]|uniref:Lipopolysaccharide assembly protein B n=1 Tax=Polynucleobacter victoriensis TaxID=2049319 RepID=A0A212T4R2_9BURK|nr:lipopolysaccharide assembly protein LapB [Polynucleobacter victoriensis]SNC61053.1 Lipopolysaccharide biosynthesis regulator YciM, contains six TPR domains and a predicted metal-binding C-terminal domain [Polynucleobacter victoriensis]